VSVCDVFDWFAPVYAGLTDLYEFNRSVLICACLRQFCPVLRRFDLVCAGSTDLCGLY
jgi:hypothetical protein